MSSSKNAPDKHSSSSSGNLRRKQSLQSSESWRRKDESLRGTLMRRLEETGERDRLHRSFRADLIESGWRDEMKEVVKDAVRNQGLTKVTVDELVAEVLPRGKATIPEDVKANLLDSIRNFVRKDGEP